MNLDKQREVAERVTTINALTGLAVCLERSESASRDKPVHKIIVQWSNSAITKVEGLDFYSENSPLHKAIAAINACIQAQMEPFIVDQKNAIKELLE